MKIKVTIRLVLFKSETEVDFPDGTTVEKALIHVAGLVDEKALGLMFNSRGRPIVLTLVNSRSVTTAATLKDGDHLVILANVTGG
ncbi:MoaD/ThiS family protein [Thermodesulfobacteriota bacterium]